MRALILTITLCLFHTVNMAQSVVDDIDSESNQDIQGEDLPEETIEKISASRRVLIISNSAQGFNKGDFITLVLANKLMTRAIVAKIANGSAGIKIVKVYQDDMFRGTRPGMKVKIIRGDDSFFNRKKTKTISDVVKEDKSLIEDDDNLFDETTLLNDDLNLEENSKRLIRTDHLVFASGGQLGAVDTEGASKNYLMFGGSYAYQFQDNVWGEFAFARNNISDFPTNGTTIALTSFIFRLKYTIAAPSYSYLQPYIGYQTSRAGSFEFSNDVAADQEAEEASVARLQESGIVFGVTLLKRLVPGWFARLDVGTDIIALGFGLEF